MKTWCCLVFVWICCLLGFVVKTPTWIYLHFSWLVKSHLFLGGITKLKRIVRGNQDFMQMRLLWYCNVIGCGREHRRMHEGHGDIVMGMGEYRRSIGGHRGTLGGQGIGFGLGLGKEWGHGLQGWPGKTHRKDNSICLTILLHTSQHVKLLETPWFSV